MKTPSPFHVPKTNQQKSLGQVEKAVEMMWLRLQ